MSNHPIIKALQEELAKERIIAINETFIDIDGFARFKIENSYDYKSGHEAASARLLSIVEKAVEMADWIEKRHAEDTSLTYTEHAHKSAMTYRKAREFLTTLADASGEKEIK